MMDVRSIRDIAPSMEHQGTTAVWWLFKPREMLEQTAGGHLELIDEFEVAGGGEVHPHKHPTWEFYFVTQGRGVMTIEDETREITPGDLVLIPPDAVHSVRPISENAPIHCFCFAMGVAGSQPYDYSYDQSHNDGE
jgi:quercetin dioxygenase-like cupin family protein